MLTIVWLNGDGSVLDTKTFQKGTAEPVTDKVPVKAEDENNKYIFAGWNSGRAEGTTKTYTPQFASVKKEKEKAPTHVVTFFTNGGTAISPQTVEDGKTAVRPSDPVKTGFVFDGWYTDASFKTVYDFNQAVKVNTVLFAKWKTNEPLTAVAYTPTNGTSLNWVKDSNSPLTITVKRSGNDADTFSHFTGVQLDGTMLVNGTDYTAKPGSVVITMSPAVLEKLAAGEHTVRVNFDDGRVDMKLAVAPANGTKNPAAANTGDTSGMILWGILFAGAAGLAAFLWYRRKRA